MDNALARTASIHFQTSNLKLLGHGASSTCQMDHLDSHGQVDRSLGDATLECLLQSRGAILQDCRKHQYAESLGHRFATPELVNPKNDFD